MPETLTPYRKSFTIMYKYASILVAIAAAALVSSCQSTGNRMSCQMNAMAVMEPTVNNTARGMVRFTQVGKTVQVHAEISGLEPNSTHAIHVHEYGDCTALDAKSAGGHYNPEGYDHGLPPAEHRHAGDLGNLTADASGNAVLDITVDNLSVCGCNNPILGRAVILHAKPDDGGQPTGNAGSRIACGIIGAVKPAM